MYREWGTKWNVCNCETINNGFLFETAWNSVTELMLILSKKNPNVLFRYEHCSEDISYVIGKYEIQNGVIIKDYKIVEGSKEAYEFAFKYMPHYKDDMELCDKSNKYVWKI